MSVWALGINHETAPLDLRGRFAFALDQVAPTLAQIKGTLNGSPEVALLSTCNRTEVYCAAEQLAVESTLNWMASAGGVGPETLHQHAYLLTEEQVARHAFRVASGLDSMVLGEPQILGQLKDAVRVAQDAGSLGTTLNQMFQRSFAVAKEVRTTTEIGAHSISMSAAAVRLAGQLFESLNEVRVLFVGAGEMIELASAHFSAKQPRSMAIANRTPQRGEHLAQRIGAQTIPLVDVPEHLHEYDIVVSCTASSLPIIGLGAVERALKKRKHKPMFMVDLAVPRDIEPEVKALSDVFLYTVDDLAQVVQTGKENRQAAVVQAEAIIDTGVRQFMQWMGQRHSVPLIQHLHQQAIEWQSVELEKARKRLAKGEAVEDVMQQLAQGLTHKMLHPTLSALHKSEPAQREQLAATLTQLFNRPDTRRS